MPADCKHHGKLHGSTTVLVPSRTVVLVINIVATPHGVSKITIMSRPVLINEPLAEQFADSWCRWTGKRSHRQSPTAGCRVQEYRDYTGENCSAPGPSALFVCSAVPNHLEVEFHWEKQLLQARTEPCTSGFPGFRLMQHHCFVPPSVTLQPCSNS